MSTHPNEQMKAIQKELGEFWTSAPDENEALKRKIDAAKMPKEAKEKAEAELQKLKMMSPMSAEATVVRGYIDWMAGTVECATRSRPASGAGNPRAPTITVL
ncbi:hypothetical protein ACLBOM_27570 [Escherichia coli]